MYRFLLIIFLLTNLPLAYTQNATGKYLPDIVSAVSYSKTLTDSGMILKLLDAVITINKHKIHCDSALLNDDTKNVNAMGNVMLIISDTLQAQGDILIYNADKKYISISGNVTVKRSSKIYVSQYFTYNVLNRMARLSTDATLKSAGQTP
ncbi:MAG: hypothetical protein H0X33_00040 [Taibaiella sp.]|nr:hypothetical protein [Taibaiella sp.]